MRWFTGRRRLFGRGALRVALTIILALSLPVCAYTTPEPRAARAARYLQAHPQTPPETAEAIQEGRVVVGMEPDQVIASVGPPERHAEFEGAGRPEVWIYPAVRFNLKQPGAHSALLLRILFLDGRVRSIVPI